MVRIDEAWTVVIATRDKTGTEAWFAQLFGDAIATHLNEVRLAPVLFEQIGAARCERALYVESTLFQTGTGTGVRVTLERGDTGHMIWTGHCQVASGGAPPIEDGNVVRLVSHVSTTIRHHLYRLRHEKGLSTPDVLYEQAVRDIFSMQDDRVAAADKLLERAYHAHPRGLFLAVRAQIRAIQRVERFSADTRQLIEDAEEFLARSLEDEPDNSMVLALASNTYGHLMRMPDRSLEYAGRSTRINPSNPMAWWSLSSSNMYIGNIKASLDYATRGLNLSRFSHFRYWWDQQAFGAVYLLGRHHRALEILRRVHHLNPSYRPPLRYLISLYAHFQMEDELETTVKALQALEPDFEIRRMVEDLSYPASLIHRAPGLNLAALRSHYA